MTKKIFSFLIIILLILFPGYIVGLLHQNILTGLIFLNISKSITKSSDFISNINNLNEYMHINSLSNLPSKYFPIFDKPPLYRLVDGYSSCDGIAGIYLWVLMFNGADTEIIPLYYENNEISSHSVIGVKYNSKKYYIDPIYKTIFLKNNDEPASLNDICNKKINLLTKKYLDNYDYNYNLLCNSKEGFKKNPDIPKFLFQILNLIPKFYINRTIDQAIDIKYRNNDYIKARLYFVNNSFDKAEYYFNEVISSINTNSYHDIKTIKNKDWNLYYSYIEKMKKISDKIIDDRGRFFSDTSIYSNSSYYTPYLNYYELSLFYNLLIQDNLINIDNSSLNIITEHKIKDNETFLNDSPSKYMYTSFMNFIKKNG